MRPISISSRIERLLRPGNAPRRPPGLYHDGGGDVLAFQCNVCGNPCEAPLDAVTGRETPSCRSCGSTLRMRSIVHVLSSRLFGESLPLPQFPSRRDIRGIGMSDPPAIAGPLSRKLGYVNTYYHKKPRLDITSIAPDQAGIYDFIISSDVFEHIPRNIEAAFLNCKLLLKPGGFLVFTVPYNAGDAATIEHYPDLYDYRVVRALRGRRLVNTTKAGTRQEYDNLRYHGGAGATLEMRSFGIRPLRAEFHKAGFGNVTICDSACLIHGVLWDQEHDLPMLIS